MHVGLSVTFQNPLDRLDDADVYHHELGFALQAEMWGFDSVWVDEHHFSGHSLCPDPLQVLTYLAGQTRHIRLGTGRLSLPRPDPVRLAEQITLLDNLSAGRVLLGIDAGPSAVEPARTVLDALERGYVEADGETAAPRRALRPRPERSLRGRIYATTTPPVAMPSLASLGAGPLVTVGRPWAEVGDELAAHRASWREANDDEPPAPVCRGLVLVDEDADRAEDLAREHLGAHLASLDGHDAHVARHEVIDLMPWGTPGQVIAKLAAIEERTGMAAFTAGLCFGGMTYEDAERNIACFVDQVMPALQSWETPALGLPG